MQRILFIDRDGTIIQEPQDEQVDSVSKFRFLPGVLRYLPLIAERTDYRLVMVSNQDGLGTPSYPLPDFLPLHDLLLHTLRSVGVEFSDILIDCSLPNEALPTRKPSTAMLSQYLHSDYDLEHSFVIGDRDGDQALARNIGCGFIRIDQTEPDSWRRAADILIHGERRAEVKRQTLETNILVDLNLNGTGFSDISTGIAFFDHMLTQIPRHASIDLTLKAQGDLCVDCHHTIEDTGIALGQALNEALIDRRAIERYAFTLPMDDSLATVAIDLGGRADVLWDVTFTRETIGNVPTEMWKHFFKSLAAAARCNIAISAKGENNHHLIESIFKAFARALRQAIRRDPQSNQLPTSKGFL